MKSYSVLPSLFLALVLLNAPIVTSSRLIGPPPSHHGRCNHHSSSRARKTMLDIQTTSKSLTDLADSRRLLKSMSQRRPDTLEVPGSGLPDCTNACGPCRPCRLAMVSFVCATIQEAETCPMAYKCICREKAFPIP